MICLLAERAGSDLWPHDERQFDIIQWFSWNAQHLYRHGGALFFENIVKRRFGLGEPDRAVVDAAIAEFRRYAAVLNRHLANRQWLLGDGLTVADFSVGVTLPYADEARMPLNEFAEVRRWHDQLNAIDAWRNPFPPRAERRHAMPSRSNCSAGASIAFNATRNSSIMSASSREPSRFSVSPGSMSSR